MNVLLIVSDQQNRDTIGKVNPQYITPNLDALCEDGVFFKHAYSPNPVCGPYRGCIMTGKYTSKCHVYNNGARASEEDVQLAELMKQAGYNTAYVGKYHLGNGGNVPVHESQRRGFDKVFAFQCYNGFEPAAPHNNEVVFFDEQNERHQFYEHRTNVVTKLAMQTLDEITKDEKPFFMMIGYQAPHYPEQPSRSFEELYKDTVFTLPEDYQEVDPYTQTFDPPSIKPKENCPDYQKYGNNIQKYTQLYAGLCSQIDSGVGKIINKLKKEGLYENTLIVYTSDHGDMQGSRGLVNKCFPYERSCGVPMIVKYPNGRRNEISDELVSGLDLFKTSVDVSGLSYDMSGFSGTSLTNYMSGANQTTQDFVISEYAVGNHEWRMIRDRHYKIITDFDYNPTEVYDMTVDTYEQNNLIKNERIREHIISMAEILKAKTEAVIVRNPVNTV